MDPELIRGLDVGQAAYIYRGGVTYVQVKRLVAGPAELASPVPASAAAAPGEQAEVFPAGADPAAAAAAADPPRVAGQTGAGRPADVSALLDEAFGEEP